MRSVFGRTAAALVVALVVLATPAAAFADHARHGSTTTTTTLAAPYASCTGSGSANAGTPLFTHAVYECELAIFQRADAQIDATFSSAVAQAQSQYRRSLGGAVSIAGRSAALQAMQGAIIQAATARAAALTALGPEPVWHKHR